MKKKMMAIICAVVFSMSLAGVAVARSVKCTVTKVEGNNVTLDCGSKADKLSAGQDVSVKPKKKAIEGC